MLARTSKTTPKHIKKREKYYTRFMQGIFRCEVLKSCSFLEVFLTEGDTKKFQQQCKEYEKIRFSRSLKDLVTESG